MEKVGCMLTTTCIPLSSDISTITSSLKIEH